MPKAPRDLAVFTANAQHVVNVLRALANERRLMILCKLVEWGEATVGTLVDAATWEPFETYDVWHDRATFHFLTDPKDHAYAERVVRAVRPGGHVIIGTFDLDGPERCSGLHVARHDAASLGQMLGKSFKLLERRRHGHQTPMGATQWFQFSRFQRTR